MATERHFGQVDKAGQAYIQHPLRVMQNVLHPDAKIVAVLHDILEDTPTTTDELRAMGFQAHIIDAILALTKTAGENRFQAAQRTAKNAVACEVKLSDLHDNMDLSRLTTVTAKDRRRYQQYVKVKRRLERARSVHLHLIELNLTTDYPRFQFQSSQQNFQYLLNAMFDLEHSLGGVQIGSPQEWWILFEDVSAYFAYCQRKGVVPKQATFLNLILTIDRDYFGGIFQTEQDRQLFFSMFNVFMQNHFYRVEAEG